MRVGWLSDRANFDGTLGGAELTQREFRDAAPEWVEVVDCSPGRVERGLDAYVVHNCVTYTARDLWQLDNPKVVKYVHDMWPHGDLDLKALLLAKANHLVFCSPLQRARFTANWVVGEGETHVIPPQLDLDRFDDAAERSQERSGAVAVGPWMNWGKNPDAAAEWAAGNGGIDFYGGGPCAPPGSLQVPYEQMPDLLARYKTFVHLPSVLEPFGRTVVEAWAAGCDVVVNDLVGARYWIQEDPDALETASENFWRLVTE